MIVSLIVAVGENLEIGKNNDLLWHLPKDMKYFRETTTGHHVIMGRKSFESIPEKYRPLPNRTNVVISRNTSTKFDGATMATSIKEALTIAKNAGETEVFIIGGGQIYKAAMELDLVNKMYVTHVHNSFEADTFFPNINASKWNLDSKTTFEADEKNPHSLSFCIYSKK